ncbi:zinc-binding alcohol dehydrogenase family protein [Niabella sp. W65]|nr:zinc-binding alcohol dehydrogenase family protein [Niabella sp. W65]MCH7361658.1 zinc-binding alcohol dehydrogenase family protein [Niabella sp. W65]ULT45434.1 zinc-binding alcohol dehydrogenase family protein [Niabella sp. I65]
MKAVGFKTSLPINEADSFIDFETDTPRPTGHEILVQVKAISVNPVDYKIRQNSAKEKLLDTPKIIGWDAAGIVEEVGNAVTLFKPGDEVYYAGDITKSGANAQFQLVDERIVGKKPATLTFSEAAAMPLTTLTAWEILFDRMRINEKDKGKTVLIIGGAGGVGSIAIQIAKKVAGLTVLATASRPESAEWCRQQGADYVVHHRDLVNEVRAAGFQQVDFILDFVDVNQYWDAFAELIHPQGAIGSISDPTQPVNLRQLKSKSVSFHWELMFTRSMFQTEDIEAQHHILNKAAELFDNGTLNATLTAALNGLSAENLKTAHRQLESGSTIGKLVIEY